MENIKVDCKVIAITIYVAILIGSIIWIGINIYEGLTKDENEGVENFEGYDISNIESMGNIENIKVNDEFILQPNLEKKFQINNENYSEGSRNWMKIKESKNENSLKYAIPKSSEKIKGEFIATREIDMSQWTEDGTYEDFIQDFIERLESYDFSSEIEFKTRKTNIGGKEYYIVILEDEFTIGSYFCLAKDGYLYSLEVLVERRLYDNSVQNTIDEIFSTFTII